MINYAKIVQIGGYFKDMSIWNFECSGLALYCKWKTQLLILSLGGATGVINLFNIGLTDVFKTKQCWSVPKITQIGSDVLKI